LWPFPCTRHRFVSPSLLPSRHRRKDGRTIIPSASENADMNIEMRLICFPPKRGAISQPLFGPGALAKPPLDHDDTMLPVMTTEPTRRRILELALASHAAAIVEAQQHAH